ncbi:MAG: hypothetical protein GKR90_19005 [Pseudomonadales bacterium]|nr:hypothetical protein [Pseudomonadales bacterium]
MVDRKDEAPGDEINSGDETKLGDEINPGDEIIKDTSSDDDNNSLAENSGDDSPDQARLETDPQKETEAKDSAQSDSETLETDQADSPVSETQSERELEPEPEPEEQEPTSRDDDLRNEPVVIKSGKGLAFFAVLLGLIGIAGAGFLYYELIFKSPDAPLVEQISKQETEIADVRRELARELESSERTQATALEEAMSAQQLHLSEVEQRTTKTLQEALQAAPPAQREWKLAEAEYLLRIANHRVLMEQDSSGALTLLLAADQIIAELDDFSLHPVRARLADEMIALKQVPSDSSQNIYLRLEALKSEMAGLRPVAPEYQEAIAVPETALTVWQQIAAATKDLVRVRTLTEGETVRPLIAPEEEAFLHQHLQLGLSQAQLAALKRQQAVYELALTRVREYLANYMDLQAREALLTELDALSLLGLDRPLPDISGSLNELLAATGNP